MTYRPLFLFLCLLTVSSLAAQVRWNAILHQPPEWLKSAEAATIATNILLYQHSTGGWPKNVDMSVPPSDAQRAERSFNEPTIDNGATSTPIEFIARVHTAQPEPSFRTAVERGVDYLLAAQLPSGGWPQFFPLRAGYYSHITYNDGAMANVMEILRCVSRGDDPYPFIDEARRLEASRAFDRGIECILRTQIVQDGKRTVWCAQHDASTLAPAWARNFEPPSLSGFESVGIVRLLMRVKEPSSEIIAAVEGAVAWLEQNSLSGLRLHASTTADGQRDRLTVPDPNAPPLWARFYELGTNRPIYIGRNRVIVYNYNDIERERRVGYAYLGDWPTALIERHYPLWKSQLSRNIPDPAP